MDGELRSYAVTVTNGNYAVPLNRYLHNELGWVNLSAYVTDTLTETQQESLRAAFDVPAQLIFEGSALEIARSVNQDHYENRGERYFDAKTPLFIVGSTLEKKFALQKGAKFLAVSFPVYDRALVTQGYAGYRGGLKLYEDLIGQYMGVKS
jgi:nitrogenase molybdenum-iron protein beta chain